MKTRGIYENGKLGEKMTEDLYRAYGWKRLDERVRSFLDTTENHALGETFGDTYLAGDLDALVAEINEYLNEYPEVIE